MNLFRLIIPALVICSVVSAATDNATRHSPTTRQLLSAMHNADLDSEKLAQLFHLGDERIDDLVRALNDPDRDVRYRAMVVLRYVGNSKGIDALNKKCRSDSGCEYFLDVFPIPLSDFDYEAIREMSQVRLSRWMPNLESYAYALALDGSDRSKQLLAQWLERSKSEDSRYYLEAIASSVSDDKAQKTFSAHASLAEAVVANAFFLQPTDRTIAKARLLALSSAGDKALVEVHINHGVTAERWYHVVVVKRERQWRVFSVHLIRQG